MVNKHEVSPLPLIFAEYPWTFSLQCGTDAVWTLHYLVNLYYTKIETVSLIMTMYIVALCVLNVPNFYNFPLSCKLGLDLLGGL